MNFKIEVVLSSVFVVIMVVLSGIPAAEAQMTIGGHVGFVLPLVTHAAGQTTTIADNFSIGFPLGVTFKGNGHMAYDLELVPCSRRSSSRLSYRSASTGPRMDRRRILSASVHTLEWPSELTLSQGERVSQFSHTFMDGRYGFKLKF